MEEAAAPVAAPAPGVRAGHIKKRALRNKSLSVAFSEKDLRDFVAGFHKRKKKRRKEARQKQEEAERRKRIEDRKRRKLEREYAIYGGASPASGMESDGEDNEQEADPVSGTTMYDNGDFKVTVTTSEITAEEVAHLTERLPSTEPTLSAGSGKKYNLPVSKKRPFKQVGKQRSHRRPHKRRDGKKGKKNNKRRR
ncbi:hypothetical protein Ancab_005304 [Ancistrocladus abbreviatus]